MIHTHIKRLDTRRCREANLSLPEARLLEAVLSRPERERLRRDFGDKLILRLEQRGYILAENGRYILSEDGFRALERCFA